MVQVKDRIKHNFISKFAIALAVVTLIPSIVLLPSCEEPTYSFDNPADPDSMDYKPPAIFFWPDSVSIVRTFSDTISVYALKIDSLAAAYIGVEYHWGSVSIDTVLVGDFFTNSNTSEFLIAEDKQGVLDIFIFYLPDETTSATGTGSIVEIVFKAELPGTYALTFVDSTEMRDADNLPILLNDMGEGLIHVVD